MTEQQLKELQKDSDGLLTYEYIANNIATLGDDLNRLVDNMIKVDLDGQFVVSAARYLHAIDALAYRSAIDRLVAAAIDKDRERRYLGDLMTSLYGADCRDRAAELSAADDNFRRIYKRLYPSGI